MELLSSTGEIRPHVHTHDEQGSAAGSGLPDGNSITSHMWRKTYAVQLYKADPSLLPAISLHLKHVDTQHTYSGYIRDADPDLLMMIDEVSMAQDAGGRRMS